MLILNLHDLAAWCQTQRHQDTERGRASNDVDESDYRHGRAAGFDLAALVATEQALADDDNPDHRPGLDAALHVLEQHRDSARVVEPPDRRHTGVVDALTEAAEQCRRVVERYPDTLREVATAAHRYHEEALAAMGRAGTDAEQQYLNGVTHAWLGLADCIRTNVHNRPATDTRDPYDLVLAALDTTAHTSVHSQHAALLPAEERRGWRDTLNQAKALVMDVRARERGEKPERPAEPDASPWDTYPKDGMPPWYVVDGMDDLAAFLGGDSTSFTGHLLRLIAKADPVNLNKLAEGFGMEVAAFVMWRAMAPVRAGRLAQLLRMTSDLSRRLT